MFAVWAGRIMGALGVMALGMYLVLYRFVPDAAGVSWVGAFAAVGLAAWVYLDWTALARFFGSRSGWEQLASLALIGVVVAICGLLQHIVEQHPKRWDFTEGRIHSLSERTEEILLNVPDHLEVSVTGFYESDAYDRSASAKRQFFQDFVDAAEALGTPVELKLVDPTLSPVAAERAGIAGNATVIIAARERADPAGTVRSERLVSPDEEQLANALLRIRDRDRRKIYFVTGHGERTSRTTGAHGLSAVTRHLQQLGFDVDLWSSRTEAAVPEDAAVIILAAPEHPLDDREAGLLREWVEQGGSLAVFAEPNLTGEGSSPTGLEGALLSWGLRIREDLVIDERMNVLVGDPTVAIAEQFGYHDVTSDFDKGLVFHTARSVTEENALPDQVTVFELARTTDAVWAETDLTAEAIMFDEHDNDGPLTLVALAELHRPDSDDGGMVLVAGDVDWLSDGMVLEGPNLDFVSRAVGHLARAKDVVKLPQRPETEERLDLSTGEIVLLFLFAVFVIPGGSALTGVILWAWRRSL